MLWLGRGWSADVFSPAGLNIKTNGKGAYLISHSLDEEDIRCRLAAVFQSLGDRRVPAQALLVHAGKLVSFLALGPVDPVEQGVDQFSQAEDEVAGGLRFRYSLDYGFECLDCYQGDSMLIRNGRNIPRHERLGKSMPFSNRGAVSSCWIMDRCWYICPSCSG